MNKNIYVVYLYFEFQIKKNNIDIGQMPYWISLFFFTLNYEHWKSQSFLEKDVLENGRL